MMVIADDSCDLLCLDLEKAEALRQTKVARAGLEPLARQAKALSDPTRLSLAAILAAGGEMCVCDLSWVLERAENLVSHHLGVLRSEGLVLRRRDGKMIMYRLSPRGQALLDATLAPLLSAEVST